MSASRDHTSTGVASGTQQPADAHTPVEWRCFHCDEVFTDRADAENHFGLEIATPACVEVLTAGEAAIVESRNYWRERAFAEERDHEKTGAELSSLRWDAYRIKKKYSAESDSLWFAFEHVEGRMLAAEAALAAAPRWLASGLRRLAERRWHRSIARASSSLAKAGADHG